MRSRGDIWAEPGSPAPRRASRAGHAPFATKPRPFLPVGRALRGPRPFIPIGPASSRPRPRRADRAPVSRRTMGESGVGVATTPPSGRGLAGAAPPPPPGPPRSCGAPDPGPPRSPPIAPHPPLQPSPPLCHPLYIPSSRGGAHFSPGVTPSLSPGVTPLPPSFTPPLGGVSPVLHPPPPPTPPPSPPVSPARRCPPRTLRQRAAMERTDGTGRGGRGGDGNGNGIGAWGGVG